MTYVEFHARSAFSFLEGACTPEDLIATAAELNLPAMALADRDGVYGAPRFHLAGRKVGVRAHVGAGVTCTEGFRYTVLVETRAGYQNLCRLITRAKLRSPKGESAVTPDDMAAYAEGLVCLTGSEEGPLAEALHRGGIEAGKACVQRLLATFGRGNVYVELQRHFDREEEARNHAAIELARSLRLPLLATNGVCYATPAEREIQDVFTSLRNHRTLETAGRLLAWNSERYLKSGEEMSRLFADLPQAIENTSILSSRLQFTLDNLGYEFPRYPMPEGETANSFLRKRTEEGALGRYSRGDEQAWRQIERELALIEKLNLAGYFLIVWDIVCFCREHNILVQGRGSAANSAVCYSLGITAVDPIGMDLLFERFLSEERGEWPDIDLDLPSGDQRERAIQYVYQRYGRLGAAMTANVITYRGRSAAREVGKVLGFEKDTLDRLSSVVGAWEYRDAADTLENHFRDSGLDLENRRICKFLELCLRLQDLPRHLGQHSGGMVVCQGQLDSVVPLEPATMPGRVVVQWDKDDCADMGIVKIDLLGLGMMAVLEDSIRLIRDHYQEEVDLAHLPQDDPDVYAALRQADTVGMFQVESRAQMSCLPRLRPQKFYDVVVEVAIIRPGPIQGGMVHPYLKRRQGRERVTYPHPSLEPVLARTLGVPLFQEQLLRMAMLVAGFTGGEAEELRRAMGFKRSEKRMQQIEAKLRHGMNQKGITGKIQDEIVQSITSFALYGFPESHAASFALLAYASAYLKCHYLAAFTAALLNNQPMGFYQPATIVKDAQRHGLVIKPIDVTRSDWPCTLENHEGRICVRLGMRYVKGLREEAAQAMVRERASGPWTSIDDLTRRVPALRKSEWVMLAEVGALNWIPENRFGVCNENFDRDPSPGSFPAPPSPHGRGLGPQISSAGLQPGTGLPEGRRYRIARAEPLASFSDHRSQARHRRDALWQVERAAQPAGPLLEHLPETPKVSSGASIRHSSQSSSEGFGQTPHPAPPARDPLPRGEGSKSPESTSLSLRESVPDPSARASGRRAEERGRVRGHFHASESRKTQTTSPLAIMTPEERLVADFEGTGMTIGPHPMAYHRAEMKKLGVLSAVELARVPDGRHVRVAGGVIARQRPGTAKGFVFLSLEDETGISNAIVTPDLFEQNRATLVSELFLIIEGSLQNQDNVISVKAERIFPLDVTRARTASHDFH